MSTPAETPAEVITLPLSMKRSRPSTLVVGARCLKQVERTMMRGRGQTVEQSCLCEQERPGADREHQLGFGGAAL